MELKKEKAEEWFKDLRNQFCDAFTEIDTGSFERKTWKHKGSGGGEMSQFGGAPAGFAPDYAGEEDEDWQMQEANEY